MSSQSSPIFHGMMAAIGATKYDTENGCIDTWNCIENNLPIKSITTVDMGKRGYDNFYAELATYAVILDSYHNTLTKMNNGKDPDDVYDGCFSMEVSQAFGEWFAKYIQEHVAAPDSSVAFTALQEIVDEYTSHPAVNIIINPDQLPPTK